MMTSQRSECAGVDRTLVVAPSWVGDMVMAQACLQAIKQHFPHTLVDVLAPEWCNAIALRMPEVSRTFALPVKHGELALKKRYRLAKALSEHAYQRCYVLPNSFKSALIPFFANIPRRIGYRGEWRYGLLNEVRHLNKKKFPLMVQRYNALGYAKEAMPATFFRPSLKVSPHERESTRVRHQLVSQKPVLILCPGAEFGPSKQWPLPHYAQVAQHYLDQAWQVWVLGSKKDSELTANIKMRLHSAQCYRDLAGQTSLSEAIDLMSAADLVISNDSGLMHIASALDKNLVALYGSTDPGFTPPLHAKVKILKETLACSPCFKRTCPLHHHHCMTRLSVEKVLQAAHDLIRL